MNNQELAKEITKLRFSLGTTEEYADRIERLLNKERPENEMLDNITYDMHLLEEENAKLKAGLKELIEELEREPPLPTLAKQVREILKEKKQGD
jgi:beta-phosphoglucomutase-like phosphatase (HAD superfamily)